MSEWSALPTAQDDLLPGRHEPDDEGWLISYLDVLTLIVTLLVLLLSMSELRKDTSDSAAGGASKPVASVPATSAPVTSAPVTTVRMPPLREMMPEHSSIMPQHSGVMPDSGTSAPRYQALEKSFAALALEGVQATRGAEGMTLRIADSLLFASGKAELTLQGEALILRLLDVLRTFDGDISVEGHTDDIPIRTAHFPSNWELSTARAIAVLRFLAREHLNPERLRAVGYADTRPAASNEDAAGRTTNRRVELILREP